MQRGSNRHGPRIDDEMAQETRGIVQGAPADPRVEEFHSTEPSGDDQPEVSIIPEAGADEAATDLSETDRDDRARLGAYLRRSVFPADRDALLAEARANNAPDHVIAEVERLEAGREFRNAAEAWAAATGAPARERRF